MDRVQIKYQILDLNGVHANLEGQFCFAVLPFKLCMSSIICLATPENYNHFFAFIASTPEQVKRVWRAVMRSSAGSWLFFFFFLNDLTHVEHISICDKKSF